MVDGLSWVRSIPNSITVALEFLFEVPFCDGSAVLYEVAVPFSMHQPTGILSIVTAS